MLHFWDIQSIGSLDEQASSASSRSMAERSNCCKDIALVMQDAEVTTMWRPSSNNEAKLYAEFKSAEASPDPDTRVLLEMNIEEAGEVNVDDEHIGVALSCGTAVNMIAGEVAKKTPIESLQLEPVFLVRYCGAVDAPRANAWLLIGKDYVQFENGWKFA